jgi:hypothetical protein
MKLGESLTSFFGKTYDEENYYGRFPPVCIGGKSANRE